jgi:hypothetical protein
MSAGARDSFLSHQAYANVGGKSVATDALHFVQHILSGIL